MRPIKFRGKDINTGEWRYGFYSKLKEGFQVFDVIYVNLYESNENVTPVYEPFKVDLQTVGQYTGLKDENGVGIFEGDIVAESKDLDNPHSEKVCAKWHSDGYWVGALANDDSWGDYLEAYTDWFVAGNIHDSPELLP